jgi:hypothetical protein
MILPFKTGLLCAALMLAAPAFAQADDQVDHHPATPPAITAPADPAKPMPPMPQMKMGTPTVTTTTTTTTTTAPADPAKPMPPMPPMKMGTPPAKNAPQGQAAPAGGMDGMKAGMMSPEMMKECMRHHAMQQKHRVARHRHRH